VEVRDRGVVRVERAAGASSIAPRRIQRLGGTVAEPAFGYVLYDGRKTTPAIGPLLPGPTILLKRGEPVSITVVNHLAEATAVHWHGIELDSYYDGVAGFAGHPGRIAPAIAPRDSFEARFTPPRSGTFIYHPHADEVRQQQAGMSGAIVVDSLESFNPTNDIPLLTAPRLASDAGITLLNGEKTLRRESFVWVRLSVCVNIRTFRPSMILRVMRDSTLVPACARERRGPPARSGHDAAGDHQLETGDVRFPSHAGRRGRSPADDHVGSGALLQSMVIHVRRLGVRLI
jgi:hypothetical protein